MEKIRSFQPLVSVIIPAYNRHQYIRQTVESVLNQTFQNFELIVIDDGSTDGTYEILKEYPQLRLMSHPKRENRGQSASINLGLASAHGRYIAILDSDDFWAPEKLELQVKFMENHVDVGLVYTNGYYTDESGVPTGSYYAKTHEERGDPNLMLLDCYLALPLNALVRADIYGKVGNFEERFRASQDHDMLVRIAEVTRFAYIPEYTFYYRRHGQSISYTKQALRWKIGFEILKRAAMRYPYRSATLRKRRAVLHYRLGQVYLEEGNWLQGIGHWGVSGILDPIRAIKVVLGNDRSS